MAEEFRTPFPGYDVLAKWNTPSWDDKTREVVAKRLQEVPKRCFLDPDQWATLEAACARMIPQPEREAPVPIVPFIDEKLFRDQGDGQQYENMPDLGTAWRLGISGIEQEARKRHQVRFSDLTEEQQDRILEAIQNGEVEGDPWDELPPQRFFTSILLKTVVGIYYAHPAAWSEVGFGGPASPRGYVRRGMDEHDRWEADEVWNPVTDVGGAQ